MVAMHSLWLKKKLHYCLPSVEGYIPIKTLWLVPLASGTSQRNTPLRDVPPLRYKLTALDTCFLLNTVPTDDTCLPSGRYHSLVTVAELGVSVSLQHSVLGVRQNRAGPENVLPMSVRVTTLLLG